MTPGFEATRARHSHFKAVVVLKPQSHAAFNRSSQVAVHRGLDVLHVHFRRMSPGHAQEIQAVLHHEDVLRLRHVRRLHHVTAQAFQQLQDVEVRVREVKTL